MQRSIREVNTSSRWCVLWDLDEDTHYSVQVRQGQKHTPRLGNTEKLYLSCKGWMNNIQVDSCFTERIRVSQFPISRFGPDAQECFAG